MKIKTIEDYCRLIEKLDSGTGVRSTDISKSLELSKITVALTLKKLSNEGFVQMKRYGKVRLSQKGSSIAKRMNFKHRVIESFLFTELGMSKLQIHNEANNLEHWASDDFVSRLYSYLGKPKLDPHGKEIS